MKKQKKRHFGFLKIFAGICVLLGLGVSFIMSHQKVMTYSGPEKVVVYPKGYGFRDYYAWQEICEDYPVDESFIASLNNFSYKTTALLMKDPGKNINYSPLSLYYGLALATSGAKGDTEAELLKVLGVSDCKVLITQCRNLYQQNYFNNKVGTLKIANSLWMNNHKKEDVALFKEEFVKDAAENFYASIHSVDFSKKEAERAMADWIATNTNGTLGQNRKVNRNQILSILNTVYFYDQWIDRFEKKETTEEEFYLLDGKSVKSKFMNRSYKSTMIAKGENFTRAQLALKNGGIMEFILPDEGVSPYDLLSSPEQVGKIFERGKEHGGEVKWKIPKFSLDSNLNMTEVLKILGVHSAFSNFSDFSGITNQKAIISQVKQETHIAIDEVGVEATAFTELNLKGSSLTEEKVDMILNRPFIYGIKGINGSLLFIGVCENPISN